MQLLQDINDLIDNLFQLLLRETVVDLVQSPRARSRRVNPCYNTLLDVASNRTISGTGTVEFFSSQGHHSHFIFRLYAGDMVTCLPEY